MACPSAPPKDVFALVSEYTTQRPDGKHLNGVCGVPPGWGQVPAGLALKQVYVSVSLPESGLLIPPALYIALCPFRVGDMQMRLLRS